ncbi:MAG TPA: copper resistance protein NlpE N-terminal domain-containing protein [Hyphomicrobiales bacterium]|nr:copper resistance protein NlpE N-terminal domain-containing protein [Hyphomicrobiales bacterium]
MQHSLIAAGCLSLLFMAGGCAPLTEQAGVADAAHNSRNALDWAGTYRGVLPCADCEGIETVVTLNADGTYTGSTRYLGERGLDTDDEQGTFQWDEGGNAISLSGGDPARYQVGENRLTRLALDGSVITGVLAEHYVLTKLMGDVTERYWKLVELHGQPVTALEQEPHFILKVAENRVTGFAGCNGFSGSYTLDAANARLSFGQLAMTRKFCSVGMEVERSFSEVLEQADSYFLEGNSLTLNRASLMPLARFEAVYLQ